MSMEAAEDFFDRWKSKKNRCRFAIEGVDNMHSSEWITWNHNESVYFATKSLSGSMKISLHPEGGYRYAYGKEYHSIIKGRAPSLEKRDIAVWPRPELTERDVSLVAQVCFPTDFFIRPAPISRAGRPVIIWQVPAIGRAAYVEYYISRLPMEVLERVFKSKGMHPIVCSQLGDGTSISFVVREGAFDPRFLPRGSARSVVPLTRSGEVAAEHRKGKGTAIFQNEPGPGIPLCLVEIGGVSLGPNLELELPSTPRP